MTALIDALVLTAPLWLIVGIPSLIDDWRKK